MADVAAVDVPVFMQHKFQQSLVLQFIYRVLDIPVTPTVQFLNKVVDMVVYDSCPWFDSAEQLRSPTRSSTSPFSLSEQWRCLRFSHRQSSMTILRRNGCFFGAFCAIFRTPPRGVESRGARIFRALDDEEFFVIEGSLGWRSRRESDSQVTCHM